MSDLESLEIQFTAAMRNRFNEEIPTATRYNPTRMLHMIEKHGGLETVRLLKKRYPDHYSDGFVHLWEIRRFDLTLEALMLDPQFQPLFTESELKWAREAEILFK